MRDDRGRAVLDYGTLVSNGATSHLPGGAFVVTVTDHWTSSATGIRYPSGWTVAIPGQDLRIDLTPTVPGQELDTRPTTGVIYWEGSQDVRATRLGGTRAQPLAGQAYVELTGYGP